MKRNWIIGIVAALLIAGCVMWELMALVVSVICIVIYALIIAVFVGPSIENIKKPEDGEQGV